VQDLSSMAANGPWITSQAAGNMQSSNQQAMSGPGTQPVDPLPDRTHQGNPTVTPLDHPRSVLVPSGPRGGAPSPVPWTSADGSAWTSAADDEYLPGLQAGRGDWDEV
jgi:hypothetical protein